MKPKSKIKRLLRKGITACKAGNLGLAQELSHQVLSLDPDNAAAFHLGSAVARQAGDLGVSLSCAKQAALLKPCSPYYFALSTILADMGMTEESSFMLESTLNLEPNHTPALLNLGKIKHEAGEIKEAMELYERAAEASPQIIEPLTRLGSIHHQSGEFSEALKYYRAAQEKNGDLTSQALYHVSNSKRFTPDDPDIKEMESVYRRKQEPDQKSFICFALGKAYSEIGKHEKAFEKFAEGNKIRRAGYDYDPEADKNWLRSIADHFDAELLSHDYGGCEDETPIFILGMPRSGTTLTEHILSNHPDVEGAGEVKHLDQIVMQSAPNYPVGVNLENSGSMGREYVKRLREGKTGAKRVINKMPYSFFHIGMIKAMLPNAKIIHCDRAKPATCWSVFRTHFHGTHKYSCDLKEISSYHDAYEELMVHWHSMLPGFIYDLDYEQLVSNPEHEIRKLLEFCNLEFDPACLEPQKNRRPVLTASAGQVRQPVYTSSIDQWKSYEKHLSEII